MRGHASHAFFLANGRFSEHRSRVVEDRCWPSCVSSLRVGQRCAVSLCAKPAIRPSDRRCPNDVAPTIRSRTAAVGKESRRNLRWSEILDLSKPERSQPNYECIGVEKASKGLTSSSYSPRQCIVRSAGVLGYRFKRIGVIKHDVGATRQARNKAQRRDSRPKRSDRSPYSCRSRGIEQWDGPLPTLRHRVPDWS